jgi:hypothetical protein
MAIKFRHSAGFGRRMKYWLISQMLREGFDVYVPLVRLVPVRCAERAGERCTGELRINSEFRLCRDAKIGGDDLSVD